MIQLKNNLINILESRKPEWVGSKNRKNSSFIKQDCLYYEGICYFNFN